MTIARSKIIDPELTRFYHCISRCVRQGFLLEPDPENPLDFDRKAWIDDRLQFLDSVFAISVAGYSILDNHFHSVVRLDVEVAARWSPEEVARRWFQLFPPHDQRRKPIEITDDYVRSVVEDTSWVAEKRKNLGSVSWFMKCLKEPLSRLCNQADGCKGAFFDARFKSIALVDEEALLAACAYVDLNPVAAGICSTPEGSLHTSVHERIEHVKEIGRLEDLSVANQGSAQAQKACEGIEDKQWLIPIHQEARETEREGLFPGMTLGQYLMFVEEVGRQVRPGKISISPMLDGIFARLQASAEGIVYCLERLMGGRFFGNFFAGSPAALARVAAKLGQQRVINLSG